MTSGGVPDSPPSEDDSYNERGGLFAAQATRTVECPVCARALGADEEVVTDEMVERAADGLGRWWQERSHMAHRVDDDDRAMARAALVAALGDKEKP